jgi:hypothetical protein
MKKDSVIPAQAGIQEKNDYKIADTVYREKYKFQKEKEFDSKDRSIIDRS